MRNLFSLVGAAVVVCGGLGWYLGWYKVQTEATGAGHRTINIDLDTKKIAADVKKGEQKVEAAISQNSATVTTPTPAVVVPTPPPAGSNQSGFQVNSDGSVSYNAKFTLPALVPGGEPK